MPLCLPYTPADSGAARRCLLSGNRRSTRNSEIIFNAGAASASHRRQLSVAVRGAYSSSSQFIVIQSLNVRLLVMLEIHIIRASQRAIKKPCISGVKQHCNPSSRGLVRRNWHPSCDAAGGLPGFTGPFPSTSLDESSHFWAYSLVQVLCMCY